MIVVIDIASAAVSFLSVLTQSNYWSCFLVNFKLKSWIIFLNTMFRAIIPFFGRSWIYLSSSLLYWICSCSNSKKGTKLHRSSALIQPILCWLLSTRSGLELPIIRSNHRESWEICVIKSHRDGNQKNPYIPFFLCCFLYLFKLNFSIRRVIISYT
jgi:hypothetical protein